MVNKAVLVILVVVVVASLGVGILIGMQLGGGAAATEAGSNGGSNGGGGGGSDGGGGTPANATATPANGTTNQTATPAGTPTPTKTPKWTTVPPRRFSEREIALAVVDNINEDIRKPNGLEPLTGRSTTAGKLTVMAENHSEDMASVGKVIYKINGNASAARYRKANLYDTCTFESNTGEYIVTPENNRLEAIGRTIAGRVYSNGEFNANESAVAQAIVTKWKNSPTYRQPFLYENIEHIGVGVEITRAGDVYVTADVCS